jgi:ABC-type uncharacterized transport system permease subunit
MLDPGAMAGQEKSPPTRRPPRRRFGRLTLDMRQRLSPWKQSGFLAGSLVIGLALSLGVLALAGIAPRTLAEELAGTLNADSLRAVLVQAAPLILVGLGASLAFRIGFWNLGLEGQMIFGGIAATGVSLYAVGPVSMRLIIMGLAAAAGGLLWVLLAISLKIRFRVNEIIATLLLNYVATYFLFHLLYGAWQDSKTAFPQSTPLRPFERLPDIALGINSGLAIAIAMVVLVGWLVHLSRVGFYMRFLSANPGMAKVLGVPIQAVNGYVFSGVLIAFLSRNDPVIVTIVGFLVAVLYVTGQTLQVFYQIPFTMVQLIQAIIVIAVASSEFFIRHRISWTH